MIRKCHPNWEIIHRGDNNSRKSFCDFLRYLNRNSSLDRIVLQRSRNLEPRPRNRVRNNASRSWWMPKREFTVYRCRGDAIGWMPGKYQCSSNVEFGMFRWQCFVAKKIVAQQATLPRLSRVDTVDFSMGNATRWERQSTLDDNGWHVRFRKRNSSLRNTGILRLRICLWFIKKIHDL